MKYAIPKMSDELAPTVLASYGLGGANAMPREDGYAATFILMITRHEENSNQ